MGNRVGRAVLTHVLDAADRPLRLRQRPLPAQRPADGAALLSALGAAPAAGAVAETAATRVLVAPSEETRLLPAGAEQSGWSRRRNAVIFAAALLLAALIAVFRVRERSRYGDVGPGA